MKKLKNFLIFPLLICFVFTFTSTVSASNTLEIFTSKPSTDTSEITPDILNDYTLYNYEKSLPDEVQTAIEQQKRPLDAYSNLIESFPKSSNGKIDFPSNYAGSFVEGDKLIISLVNPSDEEKQNF